MIAASLLGALADPDRIALAVSLLHAPVSGAALCWLLGGHLAISAAAALLFQAMLPAGLQRQQASGVLFGFTLAVCMPALGVLGLFGCVLPALRLRPAPATAAIRTHRHPAALLAAAGAGVPQARPDSAGPRPVSQRDGSAVARRAVVATLTLETPAAAKVLRRALKDPNDEVRLLAHGLLSRREHAIESRIRGALARLAQEPAGAPGQQASLHRALAFAFWELAGLSPANDSSARMLRARAREHALCARQAHAGDATAGTHAHAAEDGEIAYLLGRIALQDGDAATARHAFDQALHAGMPASRVAPFLAEIAFRHADPAALEASVDAWQSVGNRPRVGAALRHWRREVDHAG
jgi:hypothetical protein